MPKATQDADGMLGLISTSIGINWRSVRIWIARQGENSGWKNSLINLPVATTCHARWWSRAR